MYRGAWTLLQTKTPHIGHSQHLCDMVERGDKTLAQIKWLVRDANFICAKCGRIATLGENLCKPKLL